MQSNECMNENNRVMTKSFERAKRDQEIMLLLIPTEKHPTTI